MMPWHTCMVQGGGVWSYLSLWDLDGPNGEGADGAVEALGQGGVLGVGRMDGEGLGPAGTRSTWRRSAEHSAHMQHH